MQKLTVKIRWMRNFHFQGVAWDREERVLMMQVLWLGVRVEFPRARAAADALKEALGEPCTFCHEPVLASDESRWIPAVVMDGGRLVPKPVRAHVECVVCQTHGPAGCQRGQCPDCKPPEGQSLRDTAREAYEVWKAAQGKRRPKGEALS